MERPLSVSAEEYLKCFLNIIDFKHYPGHEIAYNNVKNDPFLAH